MDNKNDYSKKKNKIYKNIVFFYKKITNLISHIDYLFKNKFISQEFYMEEMHLLNDIQNKIENLDSFYEKKKNNKIIVDNLINDINNSFEKICFKIGSNNCKNTLDIYLSEDFLEELNFEFKDLFYLYNQYFVPLSSCKINDVDSFLKKNDIQKSTLPIVIKLLEYTKNNILIEKINGATIIFIINNKLIYINGFFNNDSLNIFKTFPLFKNKLIAIEEKIEHNEIPCDFKEKYIEQISLRDFIILSPIEVAIMLNNDYDEFLSYKNKSLSLLIKEFIKSNLEKQRKIILLFLISDQESKFTAHIIFDLITDKSFLAESQYLYDILYNSLHWKIQKIFKTSNENFENSKKKLENLTINNIPYDSRILALKTEENIKAKAMEKLKEINGSKENSIKAQQWLDGLLKIPFNIFKSEPIINFFKTFQNKIEKYIDSFTIRISEYNFNELNYKNQNVYNIIIQIIDEFHSNLYKSENSYNQFIYYIQLVKISIEFELNIENNIIIKSNSENENTNEIKIQTLDDNQLTNNYFLLDNLDNNEIVDKMILKNIVPTEDIVNDCMNQLTYFKKIKNELFENNIINKGNLGIMIKKLHELECMLNINLLKNDIEKEEESNIHPDNYNNFFKNFIIKNLEDFDQFIKEWNGFKIKKKNYMKDIDKILDKCTYGQNDAKNQMKRIIGQLMNGVSKGQCFGLHGPPGVGKTTLCKNGLAKCLFDENGESRPFAFLPLGGATNGSILEGHHYTYLGSTWGKIVDILMETKCMNPIIYIDELDKISKTEHGREIISILTHITDQSQNKEYYDRYFASIPIDLSQVLFIFSYNDRDSIDRILRDRIQEINIKALSLKEKLVISQNYIIPEILNNVGFSINEVIFNIDILTKIINEYTFEAGIRKLNEILYDIIRDINLKKIVEDNNIKYPIELDDNYLKDFLSNLTKITSKKIQQNPRIGLVNGLYATKTGLGGLTVIQVMQVNSDKKFSLEKLTGSQGDVMKESMNCAMTLAWNIIPDDIKKEISESKEGFGLHIHCPDGGTPKDGPSAGLAITMGIVSRLVKIPIKNDLALTGEVDLIGDAHEIGGLYSKLSGAFDSGIKVVLIPEENRKDLEIILKKEEEENKNVLKLTKSKININNLLIENDPKDSHKIYFRNSMEIIIINNIFDVLKYGLIDNNLEFNKMF